MSVQPRLNIPSINREPREELYLPRYLPEPRTQIIAKYRRAVRRELIADNPICRWCQCALTFATSTIEHIQPLSRGGTDERENLTLACWPCNQERGSNVRWPHG